MWLPLRRWEYFGTISMRIISWLLVYVNRFLMPLGTLWILFWIVCSNTFRSRITTTWKWIVNYRSNFPVEIDELRRRTFTLFLYIARYHQWSDGISLVRSWIGLFWLIIICIPYLVVYLLLILVNVLDLIAKGTHCTSRFHIILYSLFYFILFIGYLLEIIEILYHLALVCLKILR